METRTLVPSFLSLSSLLLGFGKNMNKTGPRLHIDVLDSKVAKKYQILEQSFPNGRHYQLSCSPGALKVSVREKLSRNNACSELANKNRKAKVHAQESTLRLQKFILLIKEVLQTNSVKKP